MTPLSQPLSVKILGVTNLVIATVLGLPALGLGALGIFGALFDPPNDRASHGTGQSAGIPGLSALADRIALLVVGGVFLLVAGIALTVGFVIGVGLLKQRGWARMLGLIQGVTNALAALGLLVLGIAALDGKLWGFVLGVVASAPLGIFAAATLVVLWTNPWQQRL